MTQVVQPYTDRTAQPKVTHFVTWHAGEKNSKANATTICGLDKGGMQANRFFDTGDPRNDAFWNFACETCRSAFEEVD